MKGRTILAAMTASFGLGGQALAADDCTGVRTAATSQLVVEVAGVKPPTGEVAVTVYPDDKRRFMAPGGKLLRDRVRAAATVRACFWLAPGVYAVAVYHDKNGDRNFDRTALGLPAEGFGFSNDPETKVGLPPLSAVRFRLPNGQKLIQVRMKYLR